MVGKPAEAEVALHRASFECELLDPNLCGDLDNLKPKVMSLLSQQRGPSSAAADVASCERGPSSFSSAADAAAGILAGVRLSDACAGCGATRAGGADLKSCAACGHVFCAPKYDLILFDFFPRLVGAPAHGTSGSKVGHNKLLSSFPKSRTILSAMCCS